jgi:hypothetical protein
MGERGEDIEARFGLGSYGFHEIIDRLHVIRSNWEEHVVNHPSVVMDRQRFRQAREIGDIIADFYQDCALEDWLEEEEGDDRA